MRPPTVGQDANAGICTTLWIFAPGVRDGGGGGGERMQALSRKELETILPSSCQPEECSSSSPRETLHVLAPPLPLHPGWDFLYLACVGNSAAQPIVYCLCTLLDSRFDLCTTSDLFAGYNTRHPCQSAQLKHSWNHLKVAVTAGRLTCCDCVACCCFALEATWSDDGPGDLVTQGLQGGMDHRGARTPLSVLRLKRDGSRMRMCE